MRRALAWELSLGMCDLSPCVPGSRNGKSSMADMIWNERIKLRAGLLNALAGAACTVWILAPAAAILYTDGRGQRPDEGAPGGHTHRADRRILYSHLAALRVLDRLRE